MNRPRQTIAHLPIEQLTANPANVREHLGDLADLARSILELGVVEPLIVTEHPSDGYLLLDGHRRLAAGAQAGLKAFPAIIRHDVIGSAEQTITMLATDVHKKAFTPMERAKAYGSLRDVEGLTGAEIARRVGVSTATVAAYLNLLHLDGETAEKVDAGEIAVHKAVDAVVELRQGARVAAGAPVRGRPKTYVGHFVGGHRLASTVRALCTHPSRPQVGSMGCGQCWERAIVDEDPVAAARARKAEAEAEAEARALVDPVLVERFLNGEHDLAKGATRADRHVITDAWLASGRSTKQLEDITDWRHGRYGLTRADQRTAS